MKHEAEIALAKELARQRKELKQKGYDRIEELVRKNGNRVMLKKPVLAHEHGLGHKCDEYMILGFEVGRLKRWLQSGYQEEETLNIIYDTNGAGGMVPLPNKCQLQYEATGPATTWGLVELVEDALGI